MIGKKKIISFITTLVFLSLFLPGCSVINQFGSGTGEVEPEIPKKMGTLQCTQECADRGQCGTSDQGTVILAHRTEPVVIGHNRFFVAGRSVQIMSDQMTRTLQPVVGGEPFLHNFNQVALLDEAGNPVETAWLTGWCVQPDE